MRLDTVPKHMHGGSVQIRDALDETALYNIAWQYALDVKQFGYI